MKSTYVGTRAANMGDIRCKFALANLGQNSCQSNFHSTGC